MPHPPTTTCNVPRSIKPKRLWNASLAFLLVPRVPLEPHVILNIVDPRMIFKIDHSILEGKLAASFELREFNMFEIFADSFIELISLLIFETYYYLKRSVVLRTISYKIPCKISGILVLIQTGSMELIKNPSPDLSLQIMGVEDVGMSHC